MIPLRIAVGFLFLGAALALVGATWVDLAPEHRIAIAGAVIAFAVALLGIELRAGGSTGRRQ